MTTKAYKKTEIGLIPEDWDLKKIKDITEIKTGKKNTQDRELEGAYPFFVRSNTVERINTFSFDGEAVLTAGDGVGTGKVFHYINGKFDYHQRVYKISNFIKKVDGYYFYKYFSENFYKRIMQMTAKSSVDSVRLEMIAEMLIPLPKVVEQTAIATTLSDIDSLITSQKKLIDKKKMIKQGVMQELLTGKRRLPGFNRVWDKKKLGEVLGYEQPTEYIVSSTDYIEFDEIPVLTAGKTFILGYCHETTGIFNNLPIIIFDDFTTVCKYVDFPFKVKSSAMKMLQKRNREDNLRFIFEKMQLIDFILGDHKRHWISEYSNIDIEMPEPSEQDAIGVVLEEIGKELIKLEENLSKLKRLKQGAMQQLLTGTIRLL